MREEEISARERERERERERRKGRRYEDWPRKEKRNDFIYFFSMSVRILKEKKKSGKEKKFYIPLFDLHGEEKRNYNRRKII